eukprot:tig00000880_g5205.t1
MAPAEIAEAAPVFYLLGPGRMGKSCTVRLLKILYSHEGITSWERELAKERLVENLMDAVKVLLDAADLEDSRLPANKIKETRTLMEKWADLDERDKTRATSHFKELAQDPGFRASMLRVLHDPKNPLWPGILAVPSAEYLTDHHERILDKDYLPTAVDCLHVRTRTTGIYSTDFEGSHFGPFAVVDTGGERSERRKWPMWWARDGKQMASRVFPVFVARLDSFGEQLFEAEGDMMRDMVDCWRGTLAAPFVKEAATPYFLLLSKVDGLRKTLGDGSRLKQVFPGYSGGSSVDAAVDFVREMLEGVAAEEAPGLPIRSHVVNSVDVEGARPVWDSILTEAMQSLARCKLELRI